MIRHCNSGHAPPSFNLPTRIAESHSYLIKVSKDVSAIEMMIRQRYRTSTPFLQFPLQHYPRMALSYFHPNFSGAPCSQDQTTTGEDSASQLLICETLSIVIDIHKCSLLLDVWHVAQRWFQPVCTMFRLVSAWLTWLVQQSSGTFHTVQKWRTHQKMFKVASA